MPNTHTEMRFERVAELIEAYGSNTQCWPELERVAAITCLESSASLQQLMKEAKQLDTELLSGHIEQPVDEALLSRIVDQLPEQTATDNIVTKLGRGYQWPAAIAAAVTGLAIILVVMNGPKQEMEVEQLALQEMDYWLWQDVTGQVSFDNTEELPTDFMSML